jgi:hypothetical protein
MSVNYVRISRFFLEKAMLRKNIKFVTSPMTDKFRFLLDRLRIS